MEWPSTTHPSKQYLKPLTSVIFHLNKSMWPPSQSITSTKPSPPSQHKTNHLKSRQSGQTNPTGATGRASSPNPRSRGTSPRGTPQIHPIPCVTAIFTMDPELGTAWHHQPVLGPRRRHQNNENMTSLVEINTKIKKSTTTHCSRNLVQ